MNKISLFLMALLMFGSVRSQNVGIGTATPNARLHIKGNADTSQLVIDAHTTQSNSMPLIKLRDASGNELMRIHTDGAFNVFMGYGAGSLNNANAGTQSGLYNTFIGSNSGYYNTGGSFNTALGRSALYQNNTGSNNTGLGYKALFSNTTGLSNTAVGNEALLSTTLGSFNTALGRDALRLNTTGAGNTAIGGLALEGQSYSNGGTQIFTYNTAVGYEALLRNQPTSSGNGSSNTAIGAGTLASNSIGYFNTAVGRDALGYNTTGSSNIAIGANALNNNTTGSHNIGVGSSSGTEYYASGVNNTVGIANYDALNGASNQVIIGNNSMVFTGGHVNWGIYSDARIKKNVLDDVKGLDFIIRLQPVTYNKSVKAFAQLTGKLEGPEFEGKYDVEKIRFSGFLAQEVELAAKEAGYDFDGIYTPKNEHDLYKLSYASFVVPLVKAMQEQQQEIEQLKKANSALQIDNQELKARLDKVEKLLGSIQ